MVKILFYCLSAFWIVGADWGSMQLLVFYLLAFTAFSYGNYTLELSIHFNKKMIQTVNSQIFSHILECGCTVNLS